MGMQTLMAKENAPVHFLSRPEQRRATSYDVAKLAGVSQSAVSRVFKPGASVSEKMRKRVVVAAEELGYRPNAIARGLITQRSNMVAVVISNMTNLYYPEVLVQLTHWFSAHSIRVLLFALERESDSELVIDQILQYRVDGVVTAALFSREHYETLQKAGIPVVFYNRSLKDGSVTAVRCDQEEGERWLVGQLVAAGHKSFAIVTGPADSTVSVERTAGATRKLNELGISDLTVVGGDYSYESGRRGVAEILAQRGEAPDVVIAANDVMAIGCIDEAREALQLSVPEQLSVVGFDGVGPAAWTAYDLTTVRQPVERMTQAAVAMLVERINNPSLSSEERVFAGNRIPGGSARLLENTAS